MSVPTELGCACVCYVELRRLSRWWVSTQARWWRDWNARTQEGRQQEGEQSQVARKLSSGVFRSHSEQMSVSIDPILCIRCRVLCALWILILDELGTHSYMTTWEGNRLQGPTVEKRYCRIDRILHRNNKRVQLVNFSLNIEAAGLYICFSVCRGRKADTE